MTKKERKRLKRLRDARAYPDALGNPSSPEGYQATQIIGALGGFGKGQRILEIEPMSYEAARFYSLETQGRLVFVVPNQEVAKRRLHVMPSDVRSVLATSKFKDLKEGLSFQAGQFDVVLSLGVKGLNREDMGLFLAKASSHLSGSGCLLLSLGVAGRGEEESINIESGTTRGPDSYSMFSVGTLRGLADEAGLDMCLLPACRPGMADGRAFVSFRRR